MSQFRPALNKKRIEQLLSFSRKFDRCMLDSDSERLEFALWYLCTSVTDNCVCGKSRMDVICEYSGLTKRQALMKIVEKFRIWKKEGIFVIPKDIHALKDME